MEDLIKKTLLSNGIFQSHDYDQLICLICAKNEKFLDWKKHIEGAHHSAILEHFRLNFSINGDGKVGCKICGLNFHFERLDDHAKMHQIVPWHSPMNLYKIYFENHILEWDTKFYCYSCDVFIPEWAAAFLHTEMDNHRSHVKMEVPSNDLSSWGLNLIIPYKLLVNEGFVAWALKRFKCTICNRQNILLANVSQHVEGYQHVAQKKSFIRELSEWRKSKIDSSEFEKKSKNDSCPIASDACIYVIQDGVTNYCKICDIELDSASVDVHIRGIPHLSASAKYGCDFICLQSGNLYICRACDCNVPGLHNLYLHIKGIRHAKNSYRVIDYSQIEEPGKTLDFQPTCLPIDHIIELDNCELFCQLCNWMIIPGATDDHVNGKSHAKAVLQFYENITKTMCNKYHCKCCDCIMLGDDNLYRHLNGNRHSYSIKASNDWKLDDVEIEPAMGISASIDEPPKVVEDVLCYDHIVEIDDKDYSCKICDCTISKTDIDAHLRNSDHAIAIDKFRESLTLKKGDKYHCKDCDCMIRGIDNVYLHIHGNRHLRGRSNDRLTKTLDTNDKRSEIENKSHNSQIENIRDIPKINFDANSNLLDCKINRADGRKSPIADEIPISGVSHDDTTNDISKPKYLQTTSERLRKMENFEPTSPNNKKKRIHHDETIRKSVILQLLDPDDDWIYGMGEKWREIELCMKSSVEKNCETIYCLICRKDVTETWENYHRHLWTLDHCEYLEGMEKDHATFELVPGQFSELDLAFQRMEEISEDILHCHICNVDMKNIDGTLRDHIDGKNHEIKSREMNAKTTKIVNEIRSLEKRCDWNNIVQYSCLPCSAKFESELNFVIHLKSIEHEGIVKKLENTGSRLIYDFCEPCAILWYGFRSTNANHCQSDIHKSSMLQNENSSLDFAKSVRNILDHFNGLTSKQRKRKREILTRDIGIGLSVENTKVIKILNDIFPTCKYLLPFLDEWLKRCNLSGSDKITTYALYWCVIFFLQKESILPSVGKIISAKGEFDATKSEWKLDVAEKFKSSTKIEQLLVNFFIFYTDFDYRYDVVCPFFGTQLLKLVFIEPDNLPEEITVHIGEMENIDFSKSFGIDSVLCVQDPFDLRRNLAEGVKKSDLKKFRSFCCKTHHALSEL